jgi:hypothetical protein
MYRTATPLPGVVGGAMAAAAVPDTDLQMEYSGDGQMGRAALRKPVP